ncbi:MAG: hypothetical protein G01um101419_454 [Parcubacteria group bacterium Gr01-1014_19]|nr:MAG: hypothetical protein G01um101419_454 [Parcubacteria group bacterium Gr01-1014_19]
MFGLIRLLILLAIASVVAGAAFYFAPDSIKEQGLAYLNDQNYIPLEIKKAAENLYATPKYQREILIEELDDNFETIESIIQKYSEQPTSDIKTVQRTREIVKEISEIQNNPTLVSKITEVVTAKVISSVTENSCPKP